MKLQRVMFPILLLPLCQAANADVNEISVSEYLENLRQEFTALKAAADKDKLPMSVSKVHVELSVIAKKSGEAGIKFYVVDAGGKYEAAMTQKLSFDVKFGSQDGPFTASNFKDWMKRQNEIPVARMSPNGTNTWQSIPPNAQPAFNIPPNYGYGYYDYGLK